MQLPVAGATVRQWQWQGAEALASARAQPPPHRQAPRLSSVLLPPALMWRRHQPYQRRRPDRSERTGLTPHAEAAGVSCQCAPGWHVRSPALRGGCHPAGLQSSVPPPAARGLRERPAVDAAVSWIHARPLRRAAVPPHAVAAVAAVAASASAPAAALSHRAAAGAAQVACVPWWSVLCRPAQRATCRRAGEAAASCRGAAC